MKKKSGHLLLLSCIFVLPLNVNAVKVNAVNTGFATNSLPGEEKDMFISNIGILPIDKEPSKKPIKCFDVNKDRLIAIVQNTSDRKIICVYSDDGAFQYGYAFECYGDIVNGMGII